MTIYFVYATVFLFGLAAGSFVNVCIYRIPKGVSILAPRSACPACGEALKPQELIPVISYIALRGRCSRCRARISILYPIVELMCGLLWAALFSRFSASFQFAVYAPFCTVLLAVPFIDFRTMRIPNGLVVAALFPAAAAAVKFIAFSSGPERFRSVYGSMDWSSPLLGLLPCAAFLLISIVSAAIGKGKAAIGMGDVKLLIPAGLALGLRQCLLAVFVAVTLGGAAGIILLATGVKKRKDPIPFGPFLVAGIYAAFFLTV